MLISDDYLKQNHDLHCGGNYGVGGQRWAPNVARLAAELQMLNDPRLRLR
jgi:hypothetical protein